jgi:hypothetical protein
MQQITAGVISLMTWIMAYNPMTNLGYTIVGKLNGHSGKTREPPKDKFDSS